MTSVLSIGYGDIVPTSTFERLYVIFVLIVGVLLYSIILSVLSELFKNQSEKQEVFKQKIQTFNRIKNEFNVSIKLDNQIFKTLLHGYDNYNKDMISLVESLPGSLKNRIYSKMYENKIKSLSFFKHQSIDFILFVVPLLKSNIFEKKDVILNIGQSVEEMYLVYKGQIGLTLGPDYEHYTLVRFNSKYHFGDILLFTDEKCEYEIVITAHMTELLTLNKSDFSLLRINFTGSVSRILESSFNLLNFIEQRRMRALKFFDHNKTMEGYTLFENDIVNKLVNSAIEKVFSKKKAGLKQFSGLQRLWPSQLAFSRDKVGIKLPQSPNRKTYMQKKSIRTEMMTFLNDRRKQQIENDEEYDSSNMESDSDVQLSSDHIKKLILNSNNDDSIDSLKKMSSIISKKETVMTERVSSINQMNKDYFINYVRKSLKTFKEDQGQMLTSYITLRSTEDFTKSQLSFRKFPKSRTMNMDNYKLKIPAKINDPSKITLNRLKVLIQTLKVINQSIIHTSNKFLKKKEYLENQLITKSNTQLLSQFSRIIPKMNNTQFFTPDIKPKSSLHQLNTRQQTTREAKTTSILPMQQQRQSKFNQKTIKVESLIFKKDLLGSDSPKLEDIKADKPDNTAGCKHKGSEGSSFISKIKNKLAAKFENETANQSKDSNANFLIKEIFDKQTQLRSRFDRRKSFFIK